MSTPTTFDSVDEILCKLTTHPNPRLVSSVARFASDISVRLIEDMELADRVYAAAHELLDNAVRYSADGQSSIELRVTRSPDHVRIVLETSNESTPSSRAEVSALFAEMHATSDRCAFYQSSIRRTAKREEGSGLGRIHAEAKMELSFEMVGDLLLLRAETNVRSHGETA